MIDFNDEIIEIEELDEEHCIDIEVSGDHLFYANDILTKNSIGTGATGDFICVFGGDEDRYVYESEIHSKIIKNRLGGRVGDVFKLYMDFRSLKIYDECEMDMWLSDAEKSGDSRSLYEQPQQETRQRRRR